MADSRYHVSVLRKIWYALEGFIVAFGSYDPWSPIPPEIQGYRAGRRLAFIHAAKEAQRRSA